MQKQFGYSEEIKNQAIAHYHSEGNLYRSTIPFASITTEAPRVVTQKVAIEAPRKTNKIAEILFGTTKKGKLSSQENDFFKVQAATTLTDIEVSHFTKTQLDVIEKLQQLKNPISTLQFSIKKNLQVVSRLVNLGQPNSDFYEWKAAKYLSVTGKDNFSLQELKEIKPIIYGQPKYQNLIEEKD